MQLYIAERLLSLGGVLRKEPPLLPLLCILMVIYLLPYAPVPPRLQNDAVKIHAKIPVLKLDLHPARTHHNRLFPDSDKIALYIETRSTISHVLPLLLHMLQIIPSDWYVLFVGSEATTSTVSSTTRTKHYLGTGRLRVLRLEENWAKAWGAEWNSLSVEEVKSRLLTNASFYNEELKGMKHLFVWTSESVLCGNAATILDEWLEWDWVGAPSTRNRVNAAGLSLRNIPRILSVLSFQTRYFDEILEDQWFGARLPSVPGVRIPGREVMSAFAIDSMWHDEPLGYVTRDNYFAPDVWQDPVRHRRVLDYCPEVKMVLDMRLSSERCSEEI